jgi:hypothetical protein
MNGLLIFIMVLSLCAVLIVGGYFATTFGLNFLKEQKKIQEEQQQKLLEEQQKLQQQTTPQSPTPQSPLPPNIAKPIAGVHDLINALPKLPPPVCNKGPQPALTGLTCQEIGAFYGDTLFTNKQQIELLARGLSKENVIDVGSIYYDEACWSNDIKSCISPTCLEKKLSPKDTAICKIKEHIPRNGGFGFFTNAKIIDKYKLTKQDVGLP